MARGQSVLMAGIGFLAAFLIRLLRRTVRLRFDNEAEIRSMERAGEQFILTFWHSDLLLMRYSYQGKKISVMSSQSSDGEMMARTLRRLGVDTTRGSTSRGARAAMRGFLRKAREGFDLAFTPDGPRGPIGTISPGVIACAELTGLPIFPAALASTRSRRFKSWDRFLVPLPFSTVWIHYGEPLRLPRPADRNLAAEELRQGLNAASRAAWRLAGRPEEFVHSGTEKSIAEVTGMTDAGPEGDVDDS